MYTYPDIDDRLTMDLINKVSVSNYWEESEKDVLAIIRHHLESLDRPADFLDLGSGMGRLLPFFAPLVNTLTAAEPDPLRYTGTAAAAGKLREDFPEKKICTVCGDITSVTPETGAPDSGIFHAVMNSHVIQHIPMSVTEQMMQGLRERTAEGSFLFMTTTYCSGPEDRYSMEYFLDGIRTSERITRAKFEEVFGKTGILPVAFYTPETIKKLAGKYGFEILQIYGYHFSPEDEIREEFGETHAPAVSNPDPAKTDRRQENLTDAEDINALTVEMDRIRNENGLLQRARDVLYVLRRTEKK